MIHLIKIPGKLYIQYVWFQTIVISLLLVYPDYRFTGPATYAGVSTANSMSRYPQPPLGHPAGSYQYVTTHQGGTALHPRLYTQYTPVQVHEHEPCKVLFAYRFVLGLLFDCYLLFNYCYLYTFFFEVLIKVQAKFTG